jgi:hypothetical protein
VIATRQRYRPSAAVRLRTILNNELLRRRTNNPRYSLRAFARSVKLEHSTLSQLLRGRRAMTWKSIQAIVASMKWTGSAVLEAHARAGEKFNSAKIAARLGISIEEVNVALTDLCLFGIMNLKGE